MVNMKKIFILSLILILTISLFTGWITHIKNWYIDTSVIDTSVINSTTIGATTPSTIAATTFSATSVTGTTITDGSFSVTCGEASGLKSNTYSDGSITSPRLSNNSTLVTETAYITTSNHIGVINRSTITLKSYPMVITDSGGSGGHGVLKLIDFPIGMIYVFGAVCDVAVDSVSGIAADGTFDMALGSATTLTNSATLGNANVDFVAKVDGTLVEGIDNIDLVLNTPQTEDGHTTATDVYFCVAVTDANMTATGWMAISGTFVVTWLNTGDY